MPIRFNVDIDALRDIFLWTIKYMALPMIYLVELLYLALPMIYLVEQNVASLFF